MANLHKFKVWDKDEKRFLTPDECAQLVILPLTGTVTDGETTPNVELVPFTGLEDRDGNEVYSGDIPDIGGYISYHQQSASYRLITEKTDFPIGNRGVYKADKIKIVGTIYESPELAKELARKTWG